MILLSVTLYIIMGLAVTIVMHLWDILEKKGINKYTNLIRFSFWWFFITIAIMICIYHFSLICLLFLFNKFNNLIEKFSVKMYKKYLTYQSDRDIVVSNETEPNEIKEEEEGNRNDNS